MISKSEFQQKSIQKSHSNKNDSQQIKKRYRSPESTYKQKYQNSFVVKRKFSFSNDYTQKNSLSLKQQKKQNLRDKIKSLSYLTKQELIKQIFQQKIHYKNIIEYLNQDIRNKKDKINQQKVEIKKLKKDLQKFDLINKNSFLKQKNEKNKLMQSNLQSLKKINSSSAINQNKQLCSKNSGSMETNYSRQNSEKSMEQSQTEKNFFKNFFQIQKQNKLNLSNMNELEKHITTHNNFEELAEFNFISNLEQIENKQQQLQMFIVFFKTSIEEQKLKQIIDVCSSDFVKKSINLLFQMHESIDLQQKDQLWSIYGYLNKLEREENQCQIKSIQTNKQSLQNQCFLNKDAIDF